jgi:23S rRNA maturation-related 3'-5' exoribonuclease YhaM
VHEDYSKDIRDVAEKLNILGRNVARLSHITLRHVGTTIFKYFLAPHAS